MQVFFSVNIEGEIIRLSEDESVHCIRVLRLTEGDTVHVIDGKGGFFEAVIENASPRSCTLRKIRALPASPGRNFNIHIAISPTKSIDRFEWFVEKATEIGIDTITPLLCHRSERRVLKTERIRKLLVSTIKQAIIPQLPLLNELTDYSSFLNDLQGYEQNRYIATCEETEKKFLKHAINQGKDIIVLIGPEGDFSSEEIAVAQKYNFQGVSLGENRLRTETAGIVACMTAGLMNSQMIP